MEVRGLTRRWLLDDATPEVCDADGSMALPQRILAARGLTDPGEVARFFDPRLTHLHDPALLPNVDVAADCLADALRSGRRIAIYGDYDVDGITATAILYHLFRALAPGADLLTYVPHRLDEGYGINADALRELAGQGAEVVISVDCGVTAVDEAAVARELGLDLIITDHHHPPGPGEPRPDCVALVHPGLPESAYPFAELCGAGVAFKVAWRLAQRWCGSPRVGDALKQTLLDLLPLAALGTIADVVPLVDENRVLTSFGLRLLGKTPNTGLQALIAAADLPADKIDTEKVGFILAPRLNASGRLGHAREAVQLLTDASPAEAAGIAARLTELNTQRQQTQRGILKDAAAAAEAAGMTGLDRRIIVLADEQWHPGVVGIVCSRLAETYGRPAILLQDQGDVCKGSARSIAGYSIYDGLHACREHLLSFGGHDFAAGLSVARDRLDDFVAALTEHANASIAVEQMTAAVGIDCDAALRELDLDTVQRIGALAPFGRENRRPLVRVCGVRIAEPPKRMGANGKHLSLRIDDPDASSGRRSMRVVWWRAPEEADTLAAGMSLDVAIEPKLNEWQGRVSVEAEVRDVRVREV